MHQTKTRIFITMLTVLTFVLGALSFAFADSESGSFSDQKAIAIDDVVSGGVNSATVEFFVPIGGTVDVHFQNNDVEAVTIALQKRGWLGRWSNVSQTDGGAQGFSVAAGEQVYKSFSVDFNETYRIMVSNSNGNHICGHLRVLQSDFDITNRALESYLNSITDPEKKDLIEKCLFLPSEEASKDATKDPLNQAERLSRLSNAELQAMVDQIEADIYSPKASKELKQQRAEAMDKVDKARKN